MAVYEKDSISSLDKNLELYYLQRRGKKRLIQKVHLESSRNAKSNTTVLDKTILNLELGMLPGC
jgi:hypothetical protein